MKIIIGSKNPSKVEAVREILNEYKDFYNCEVIGLESKSGVSEQPKSIDETMQGAIIDNLDNSVTIQSKFSICPIRKLDSPINLIVHNRAKNCFKDCDYSIGIESGLMKVPYTKTGYMDVSCCAIFDGKQVHLGLSSAFEYPIKVTKLVFEEGLDINQAFHKTGLTKNIKLGSSEGAIGLLTKGRLVRKEYTKQAIRTAMIHLENPELY